MYRKTIVFVILLLLLLFLLGLRLRQLRSLAVGIVSC